MTKKEQNILGLVGEILKLLKSKGLRMSREQKEDFKRIFLDDKDCTEEFVKGLKFDFIRGQLDATIKRWITLQETMDYGKSKEEKKMKVKWEEKKIGDILLVMGIIY